MRKPSPYLDEADVARLQRSVSRRRQPRSMSAAAASWPVRCQRASAAPSPKARCASFRTMHL